LNLNEEFNTQSLLHLSQRLHSDQVLTQQHHMTINHNNISTEHYLGLCHQNFIHIAQKQWKTIKKINTKTITRSGSQISSFNHFCYFCVGFVTQCIFICKANQ